MADQSKNSLQGLLSNARRDEISRSFETNNFNATEKTEYGHGTHVHLGFSGQAQQTAFSRPHYDYVAPGRAPNETAMNSAMPHTTRSFAEMSMTSSSAYSAEDDYSSLYDAPESCLPGNDTREGPRTRVGFLCGIVSSLAMGWFFIVPVATAVQPWSEMQERYSLHKFQFAQAWSSANREQTFVEPAGSTKPAEIEGYAGGIARADRKTTAPAEIIYRDTAVEAAKFKLGYSRVAPSDTISSIPVEARGLKAERALVRARPQKTVAKAQKENPKVSQEPILVIASVVQTSRHSIAPKEIEPTILPAVLVKGEYKKSSDNSAQKSTPQQPVRSEVEHLPKQEKQDKEEKDKSTSAPNRIAHTSGLPPVPSRGVRLSSRTETQANEQRTSSQARSAIVRRSAFKRHRMAIIRTKKLRSWSKAISSKKLRTKKSALGAKLNHKKRVNGHSKATPDKKLGFSTRAPWARKAFKTVY